MDDMRPQGGPAPHNGPGHELKDVNFRGIIIFAVSLVLSTAALQVGLAAMMRGFSTRETRFQSMRPGLFRDSGGQFPGPQLQQDPARDMMKFHDDEQRTLTQYGWANRPAGSARIPIDRAMDLLIKKGLPTQEERPKSKGKAESP